jgi:hypothetical protein
VPGRCAAQGGYVEYYVENSLTPRVSYSRMSGLWTSRAVAVVIVIAGPALLLYARSDLGPWSPWPERTIFSVPYGFFACAVSSYALALGSVAPEIRALRVVVAALGCLLVTLGSAVAASPLFFGMSDAPFWMLLTMVGISALPAAIIQPVVMGSRIKMGIVEIIAHVLVMIGAFLIQARLPGGILIPVERIFGSWPLLLALTPYVALCVVRATGISGARLALAIILGLAPVYEAKAAFDFRQGYGLQALVWPLRIPGDFIGHTDPQALIKKVTTISPGVAVRIGEHWYKFDRIGFQNPRSTTQRRPDRIAFAQIDIPADDLDLREIAILGDKVQLNIRSSSPALPSMESGSRSPYIAIREGDLEIYVVAPQRSDVDRELVREKLRRFMRNARVDPPA